MVKRLTEAIDGKASPRKPSVRMSLRSSSGSLEVQWRSTASASSPAVMPTPSSVTEMKLRPPSFRVTAMRWAPASMAFSTSSLTALAGRSTTSPAAMRLTRVDGSRRSALMARPFYARRLRERYWWVACEASLRLRRDAHRLADDHRGQRLVAQQAAGQPPHIVDLDRRDQGGALGEMIRRET